MEIQGYRFETRLYSLDLQGSNAVLGMQWLRSLGRVLHDWEKLTMEFTVANQQCLIRGNSPKGCTHRLVHSIHRLLSNEFEPFLMQTVAATNGDFETRLNLGKATKLDQLLIHYQAVFQVPTELPPVRAHDHRITLELGTGVVNVQPYRYPHIQKTEIEREVEEMLAIGIIQPSFSPFSSSVLLVKKKDGSWRFCVDYLPSIAPPSKTATPFR
jgi:hypothetical protein